MQIYKYPNSIELNKIIQRPTASSDSLLNDVQNIIKQVAQDGDEALFAFTSKFDNAKIDSVVVKEQEIIDAFKLVDEKLKAAIQIAFNNIGCYHKTQIEAIKKVSTMPGIECWRKSVPIEKIGLYIPGGTAPLFSTVLMLAIPAKIAGCKEIILCTPPRTDGSIAPEILYTAAICGITKIFKCGGAQAIAAMTFGTETIPAVYKIFGPGNQYVTMAKQLLQSKVAIDMPAGPSEVLIIADNTAYPSFIAADLLAQAEHGSNSQVILISNSIQIIEAVNTELINQLNKLPRKSIAENALLSSRAILVSNLQEAIQISNQYAPEHLILCTSQNDLLVDQVLNAGSVFIGNYSPEAIGDYASGTNHTLPTNGYATAYSGVSLDSFVKKISFQQITKEGFESIAETVITMALAEGLEAHANAIKIRVNNTEL